MPTVIPNRIEKCKGALVATAIGDALGWPNEPRAKNKSKKQEVSDNFVGWVRTSRSPRWHDEKIMPGEYSDDTQLTLSVARSLITENWEKFFAEQELPFWLQYERGGGSAILKAAKLYRDTVLPWKSKYASDYFDAGGNGSVMRILPHVIVSAENKDINNLMLDIFKNTLITHGHPRAFLGASCYAYALNYLLNKNDVLEYGELISALLDNKNVWGNFVKRAEFPEWFDSVNKNCRYEFEQEWNTTCIRMIKHLENIYDSLKKGLIVDDEKVFRDLGCFGKENGAGDITILAALYLASKYANNPELGIKVPAFMTGCDTDTIASVTGGLLGMLNGMHWIPLKWRSVQDYECLKHIAELLLADNRKKAAKDEFAEVYTNSKEWYTTPIGKLRPIDTQKVNSGKYGIVKIKKWKSVLGQTLYIKSFEQYDEQKYTNLEQDDSNIDKVKLQKKLILSNKDIYELLNNPSFKCSITIGKILKISQCVIEGNISNEDIAKKLRVNKNIVDTIANYIY